MTRRDLVAVESMNTLLSRRCHLVRGATVISWIACYLGYWTPFGALLLLMMLPGGGMH